MAVDGKPLAGVVHQPFWGQGKTDADKVGRSVWAVRGCGMGQESASDSDPLRLTGSPFLPVPAPIGKTIVVTSRSRRNVLIENAVKALCPDDVVYAGGCGNKVSTEIIIFYF